MRSNSSNCAGRIEQPFRCVSVRFYLGFSSVVATGNMSGGPFLLHPLNELFLELTSFVVPRNMNGWALVDT